MRVLILGAGGFLGSILARRLAADGHVAGRRIDAMLLFDQRITHAPAPAQCAVACLQGDLREATTLDTLFEKPVDVVFHLAATLTVDAEADFRRGLDTNVLAFIQLLERCRQQAAPPMLLFASSIATFGGLLPAVVDDDVFQAPTTSYGTHKAIAELLLADYSRHRFVDARALRLPIVVTHPGPASGSISDQVAALIREPLRGRRTTCDIARDSRLVVASVDRVVDGFVRLAGLPAEALPASCTMNLPGLTTTPAQIAEAVAHRLPADAAEPVAWGSNASTQAIIDGWPTVFTSRRALALGFAPDASADALVQSFIDQERALP